MSKQEELKIAKQALNGTENRLYNYIDIPRFTDYLELHRYILHDQ